jgi:phosphatidylinositol kinase/protein kinase (PI-3  family)
MENALTIAIWAACLRQLWVSSAATTCQFLRIWLPATLKTPWWLHLWADSSSSSSASVRSWTQCSLRLWSSLNKPLNQQQQLPHPFLKQAPRRQASEQPEVTKTTISNKLAQGKATLDFWFKKKLNQSLRLKTYLTSKGQVGTSSNVWVPLC